jgi:hypothetical protein
MSPPPFQKTQNFNIKLLLKQNANVIVNVCISLRFTEGSKHVLSTVPSLPNNPPLSFVATISRRVCAIGLVGYVVVINEWTASK